MEIGVPLIEMFTHLKEIGIPLVEMSIQIMGIGFPLMEIGFPLMRILIHVEDIGIPRMETLLHLMQIGFPLKDSSILLKHASARGAEPVAPTEAPHHGHGAATRRRGVEPVVPTEAPQQRPGRRQPLQNFYRGIGDRTILPKFRVFDHVLQYKNSINPKKNRTLRRTF